MRLGRVIGQVVLSQHVLPKSGSRWLVVSPLTRAEAEKAGEWIISGEPSLVVYDDLGAGTGDLIGFTEGAEATRPFDFPFPIDAYNCAIIDNVTLSRN